MAAIITEKFRQHNADQFFESFSEASASTYYLFVGKATAFTSGTTGGSDSSPPTPSVIVQQTQNLRIKKDSMMMITYLHC